MTLGLLVVLAVAALMPSLSGGRIVSECELKDALEGVFKVPTRMQGFITEIQALVICAVKSWSHLNTGLVRVSGKRRTTRNTKELTTTEPSTTGPALEPNGSPEASGSKRRREVAPAESMKELWEWIDEASSKEKQNEEEKKGKDDRKEEEEEEEDSNSKEWDEDEWENEGGEKRKKRMVLHRKSKGRWRSWRRWRPVSREYGIFQLRDTDDCDSGYAPSKNRCHIPCSAFKDDDIKDDIDCLLKTSHWRDLLRQATHMEKPFCGILDTLRKCK